VMLPVLYIDKHNSLTVVGVTHSHVLQEANVVYKIKKPGKMCHDVIGGLLTGSY